MDILEIGLIGFAVMLVLLAFRIPIAVSMLAVGMVGYVTIAGLPSLLSYLKTETYWRFTTFDLSVVPLADKTLTVTLLLAAIYAFVAMVLALRKGRWVRVPMLLWNLVVAALVVTTPTRAGFSFQGQEHFKLGIYAGVAALVALWGSWLQWRAAGRGR